VTSKRFGIRKIELVKCSLLGEGGTILFFRNSSPTFITSAGENTVANKAAKWPNKATRGSESLKKYRKSWHPFRIAQTNFYRYLECNLPASNLNTNNRRWHLFNTAHLIRSIRNSIPFLETPLGMTQPRALRSLTCLATQRLLASKVLARRWLSFEAPDDILGNPKKEPANRGRIEKNIKGMESLGCESESWNLEVLDVYIKIRGLRTAGILLEQVLLSDFLHYGISRFCYFRNECRQCRGECGRDILDSTSFFLS
jgi:hypothetical protein